MIKHYIEYLTTCGRRWRECFDTIEQLEEYKKETNKLCDRKFGYYKIYEWQEDEKESMKDVIFSITQEVMESVYKIEHEAIISSKMETDSVSGLEYLVFTFSNCLDPWLTIDKVAHLRVKARKKGLMVVFLPDSRKRI